VWNFANPDAQVRSWVAKELKLSVVTLFLPSFLYLYQAELVFADLAESQMIRVEVAEMT
jgi:hypothetical protein